MASGTCTPAFADHISSCLLQGLHCYPSEHPAVHHHIRLLACTASAVCTEQQHSNYSFLPVGTILSMLYPYLRLPCHKCPDVVGRIWTKGGLRSRWKCCGGAPNPSATKPMFSQLTSPQVDWKPSVLHAEPIFNMHFVLCALCAASTVTARPRYSMYVIAFGISFHSRQPKSSC